MLRHRSFFAVMAMTSAVALWATLPACTKKENVENTAPPATETAQTAPAQTAAPQAPTAPAAMTAANVTELKIEELKMGTGATAENGKKVLVHYTGWLTDGKKFDSSLDRGTPLPFQIGAGQVIKGWDQGVAGMKVGGKRKLTIPPQLAYGPAGAGAVIPPNATLVFEVELMKVE